MTATEQSRKPAVFRVEDATFTDSAAGNEGPLPAATRLPTPESTPRRGFGLPSAAEVRRGFRWCALLVSAAGALMSLALSLWFVRFVSVALERQDWLGWTAFALMAVTALAALAILLREVIGFFRLGRLGRLKRNAAQALRDADPAMERATVRALADTMAHRPELRWNLARLGEHEREVRDPGDLFRLADRELLAPLDLQARRAVARAARRVSVATAISPSAVFGVGWVLVENVRLLRSLASVYGGRPGMIGTARLERMVFGHIVATGGVALTDDLLGQFLGQDLVRRLSRRLGEGVFNGALTARIGTAAIAVIRPLPHLETRPVRVRDFIVELTRRNAAAGTGASEAGGREI